MVDKPEVVQSTPKSNPKWYDGILQVAGSLAPMMGTVAGEIVGGLASKSMMGAEVGGMIGGALGTGAQ